MEITDFTADPRFLLMHSINRHIIEHPLSKDVNGIQVQYKAGLELLPAFSGKALLPTVYDFVMEADLTTNTEIRGSIERNLFFLGTYEPGTLATLKMMLRSFATPPTFVDVGAHTGLMSIFAARNGAKQVFAFEPNPQTYQTLLANIAHNTITSITPIPFALGEQRQTVSLKLHEHSTGATRIAESPDEADVVGIAMDTLDSQAKRHAIRPNIILVDVEDYEAAVLAGAENTIAAHKPDIIAEYTPFDMQKSRPLLTLLDSHGYIPYILANTRHFLGQLIPFESAPLTNLSDNLFCFTPERARELGLPLPGKQQATYETFTYFGPAY